MKRFARVTLRLLGLFVLLVIVLLLVGLTSVDMDPPTDRLYARNTRARLRELAHSSPRIPLGELRAGFGKARITPTLGQPTDVPEKGEFMALPLAGYGNRAGRPATGTHDDLWAKAVA